VDHLDLGDRLRNPRCSTLSNAIADHGVSLGVHRRADDGWTRAFLIVTVAAAVRLLFATIIPVFPDEAYYWLWSRNLAPGYFDHPPVVALLIRFGGVLFSPLRLDASGLAIRLGPIVAGWVASIGTAAIANRLGGSGAAIRAAVVMSLMPLAAAGLVLATPDAGVLAATAVVLYCLVRSLESEVGSRESLRWWMATGLALGVAFTSKYTSIFLPLAVLVAVLLRGDSRVRLREPGPYVACVIAALVFLPVLLWNAQHDWISFVFQLRHGLSAPQGSALLAAWKHEGDFFGGQAALASPILFIMMGIVVTRALRATAPTVCFVLSIVAVVTFGFFIYSGVRQRVEPNWPAPAYIPAIVLLSIASWTPRGEKWLKGGMALTGMMSVLIYVQALIPILPFKPAKDPIARAFGWTELAAAADSTANVVRAETNHRTWFAGDRYQEASELALHVREHPITFATNLGGRVNQFDLWPWFPVRATVGDNLILVVDDTQQLHAAVAALQPFFGEARRGPLVTLRRGRGEIGTRRIWELRDYHGGWPTRQTP
jgi:4-amino-4-deoxy-L-arabinose transferase-like glycosyltransferase